MEMKKINYSLTIDTRSVFHNKRFFLYQGLGFCNITLGKCFVEVPKLLVSPL